MTQATLEKNDVLATVTVADQEGFVQLEAEWRTLADECRTATIFQSYEWNAAWWRHFGNGVGKRLHLLTFRAEGRLVGLAPLMTSFWYGTPLRRLSFVGSGDSDYLDILAAPGCEQRVAEAFYSELRRSGGWQIADFQQIREGGLLSNYNPATDAGFNHFEAAGEACPFVALPADWDTLTRQFGKKTRANIGYYDRALHKVYEVEAGCVTNPQDLDAAMTRLFELHQRRWNQRWLPGVFGSKRMQQFHLDAARALLESDCLRLFYLRLDGVTQACLYCFAFGDRLYYYQGGFEPTLAKMSLGTVLTARALQTAIGEGRGVFDLLRGDEPYKAKWTQTASVNTRRVITKAGFPNWTPLARRVQSWEEVGERRAKAWMRSRK
jgi:CelD/BcsL family acetyltransferase involved in cellulose biosynthesis